MIIESKYDENGRNFQDIWEQFLIIYFNEKMTENL